MAQYSKGRRLSPAFSFGPIAVAITVDEMPKVVWSVDNLAHLLRTRLLPICAEDAKILNAISSILYIMPRVLGRLTGKRSKKPTLS